jgi:MFS family permease
MSETNPHTTPLQSVRFLSLYALAVAGGSVAYIPFLTILLPARAVAISGNNALNLLAYSAFFGAVAASIAHIAFGWASDVTRTRRPWIAAGLILSCLLLLGMRLATNANMVIGMIVCWQIALNMMLAPLSAWAGDSIPDKQKGMLGGLLAFAPAIGALAGALFTLRGFASADEQLGWLATLVVAMICPVLIFGHPVDVSEWVTDEIVDLPAVENHQHKYGVVTRMWLARLLVQIAEASLFAFLLLWLRTVNPNFDANDTASIFTSVLICAVFLSLLIGRWSDRTDQPMIPLAWASGAAGIGLFTMSVASNLSGAMLGYVIFGVASGVFLALHSSQTLRVLPQPLKRGRDLGYFNLTNTVPSMIMPWLILSLVPNFGYHTLFLLLAGLAAIACVLICNISRLVPSKA